MPDDDKTVLEDKTLPLAKEEPTASKKVKGTQTGSGGPQFLPKLLNQKVTLRLISGQPVTGELIGFNAYELLLKTPKGPFLVFKGAIMWIEGGSY
jgi:sRNA-binding regulator protein Hfq